MTNKIKDGSSFRPLGQMFLWIITERSEEYFWICFSLFLTLLSSEHTSDLVRCTNSENICFPLVTLLKLKIWCCSYSYFRCGQIIISLVYSPTNGAQEQFEGSLPMKKKISCCHHHYFDHIFLCLMLKMYINSSAKIDWREQRGCFGEKV